MARLMITSVMLIGCVSLAVGQETEAPKAAVAQKEGISPLKQAVIDNPDDLKALRAFLVDQINTLNPLAETDPDKAENELKQVQEFLKTLQPKDDQAKQLLASGEAILQRITDDIALSRLTLDDIKAALEKNPDDDQSVRYYASKIASQISPIARKEPEEAEKLMTEGQEYLKALSEKAEEEVTKTAIESGLRRLASYERTIEAAKTHLALVGTDAAKLEVIAWANGEPLTKEDLKGKVVLLDFWAVWCGPCIATFPHLIEWDQKYDDLVIIGLTRYYNYAWDAETKRAKRSEDDVAPEVEHDMLAQFAKQHKLTHRFALQDDERTLSTHYGVIGIPQAVLIDRQGKVRLIRVGSGESNAHEIEQMIEKLLEE